MHRALATVDLGAVRHNVAALTGRLTQDTSLMAVVKAEGYGHGAVQVARAAIGAGARSLGVATVAEAAALREADIDSRLLIMGPLTGTELDRAFDLDVEIIVWSLPFLKSLVRKGHARDRQIRVHVKVDTGMRRLGLYLRQLADYLDSIESEPEAELAGVMTHFATADDDEDFFRYQLRAFEDAVQVVLRTGVRPEFHCANSAAAIRFPETHFDMVRCGIAVYGLSPFQKDPLADGLRPALSLASFIADIKVLAAGDAVGYGRTWTAARDTHVGVVPIGYGDGVSRRLSNRGQVLAGGRPRDIVGLVSMDQLTIDLGPQPDVGPGEEVVLIGSQGGKFIRAEEMAAMLDTINYEVVCNLSQRVERKYCQ
ncbi:MAG: alanine racemase [Thermoleophilia bacterium]|nr:alanine racemase [Thermoleophilia bacterium]